LTAGFGYAALLVAALALRIPLGAWWGAAVQSHGHAQLFGWMGLFIIGMGLYFLPKLRGAKLRRTDHAPWGISLITTGIVLHSLAQPVLGFVAPFSGWLIPLRLVWLASSMLELGGLFFLARMLITTELRGGRLSRESPAYSVRPFLAIAAFSSVLAFASNFLGTLAAVARQEATMAPEWDSLTIQLMLYGFAIPTVFVFSVRNLPLFLRLGMPPREPLVYLAFAYGLGLVFRIAPNMAAILGFDPTWPIRAGDLGVLIQSIVILVFVWLIDLIRRRPPWTLSRAPNTRPDLEYLRKPTRSQYPDAGEYGRFELLLYSAYAWLAISALLGIMRTFDSLIAAGDLIPLDAERHSLTVGFVTLMIFGMAARMLPGFSGKRRVASPHLVTATFVLGNIAALLRTVPLFLGTNTWSLALLGSSGAVGWIAVASLAINLNRTLRS
jgi:uncharacterized protein involved in response to NO